VEGQPSPEEVKQNCIFCRIVAGAIPSKKVFEDEQLLAILDINPANKGHVLALPKEHYPILPVIPPAVTNHLFETCRKIMGAMRQGLIVPRITMFIANGPAAGQQSPHFLLHLIPREEKDTLEMLDLASQNVEQSVKVLELANVFHRPAPKPTQPAPTTHSKQPPPPSPKTPLIENREEASIQLAAMLEQNPQLRELIMKDPKLVEEYASKSPELNVLFEGVDLFALSEKLRAAQKQPAREAEQVKDATPSPKLADVPDAAALTDTELHAFLDEKPQLKELLLNDLPSLEKKAHENSRLAAFFATQKPAQVAARMKKPVIDYTSLAHDLERQAERRR